MSPTNPDANSSSTSQLNPEDNELNVSREKLDVSTEKLNASSEQLDISTDRLHNSESEKGVSKEEPSSSENEKSASQDDQSSDKKDLSPSEFEMVKHVIDEIVPVHKFLGITLREARRGYAVLHIPFRDELVGDPRFRRWHGGMLATLVDSAGGAAAITTFTSAEDQCSSIDIRVDYMNAGKPLDLLAEGELVRDGNSVLFFRMRVWHEETGEVIAEGRGAYRIRRHLDSGKGSGAALASKG